jgi:hypothetical protein
MKAFRRLTYWLTYFLVFLILLLEHMGLQLQRPWLVFVAIVLVPISLVVLSVSIAREMRRNER